MDIPFSPNTTIRDILNNELEYLLLCKKVIKDSIPFIQQPISTVLFCYNHMYRALTYAKPRRCLPHRSIIRNDIFRNSYRPFLNRRLMQMILIQVLPLKQCLYNLCPRIDFYELKHRYIIVLGLLRLLSVTNNILQPTGSARLLLLSDVPFPLCLQDRNHHNRLHGVSLLTH